MRLRWGPTRAPFAFGARSVEAVGASWLPSCFRPESEAVLMRFFVRSAFTLTCAFALAVALHSPARADVSIGTNLGVTIHSPDDGGDNVTLISIPSQANALSLLRPG